MSRPTRIAPDARPPRSVRGVTLNRLPAALRSAGNRSYVARGAGAIEVQTNGPARCATSRGYYAGMAEHLAGLVEVEHCAGPCRDQGASACRYVLRERAS